VFRLILLADTHLGNANAKERELRLLVEEIKQEPLAFWLHLGDMCEYISLHDPRFDAQELAGWLLDAESLSDIGRAETVRFLNIMQPVKDKCLALVRGNHEASILRHSECDVYSRIIEGLADGTNEHRLDDQGFLSWIFARLRTSGRWTLRLYLAHGSGGGSSDGNAANKLGKLAKQVDNVDIVAMGHVHDPIYRTIAKRRPGPREHRDVVVHTISVPALVSDMSYAQARNLPPHPAGWAEVHIEPDKKRLSVELVTR